MRMIWLETGRRPRQCEIDQHLIRGMHIERRARYNFLPQEPTSGGSKLFRAHAPLRDGGGAQSRVLCLPNQNDRAARADGSICAEQLTLDH